MEQSRKKSKVGLGEENRLSDMEVQPLFTRSDITPLAPSRFVERLARIPHVYQKHSYEKGEMKVRVSPDMAYVLRLINETSELLQPIPFLAENLINDLLKNFFNLYLPEIESLVDESGKVRISRLQSTRDILKEL